MSYEFTAPVKDPFDADVDGMDFNDWLENGESIVGVPVVEVSPPGLGISNSAHTNGIVTWKIDGGTLGDDYIVSVKVVTSKQRQRKRSILYRVGPR